MMVLKSQYLIAERNAKIVKEFRAGRRVVDIAESVGLSKQGVQWIVNHHPDADEIKKAYYKAAAEAKREESDAIARDYIAGVSFAEMRIKYGQSETWPRNRIKRHPEARQEMERRKDKSEERAKKIRELLIAGNDPNKVAELVGCSAELARYYRGTIFRELWLKGHTVETIQKSFHISYTIIKEAFKEIPLEEKAERARKRKLVEEGFAAGLSDEEIAKTEGIPLEEVRNATSGFKKTRPNPWAIKYPLRPYTPRGDGNPRLREFNDAENTLDLLPADYARYLEVRQRRALIEADQVAATPSAPAALLNIYSPAHLNGAPVH